jgi:hypothetical protein
MRLSDEGLAHFSALGIVLLLAAAAFAATGMMIPAAHAQSSTVMDESWCSDNDGNWITVPTNPFLAGTVQGCVINTWTITIGSGVQFVVNSALLAICGSGKSEFCPGGGDAVLNVYGSLLSGGLLDVEGTINNYGVGASPYDLTGGGIVLGGLVFFGGTINNYGSFLLAGADIRTGDGWTSTISVFNEECGGSLADIVGYGLEGTYNVVPCTGAPEFPFGFAFLFAILVPVLLVLRQRLLPQPFPVRQHPSQRELGKRP